MKDVKTLLQNLNISHKRLNLGFIRSKLAKNGLDMDRKRLWDLSIFHYLKNKTKNRAWIDSKVANCVKKGPRSIDEGINGASATNEAPKLYDFRQQR